MNMAPGAFSDPPTRRRSAERLWGRWRSPLLLLLLLLSLVGALAAGAATWRAIDANRTIAALAAGRDAEIGLAAAPEAVAARIGFLSARDEIDRARVLMDALEGSRRPALAAAAHYDLANALLRRAFALLERGELATAGPFVTLARRGYRRALQLDPELWDAKYNLDVASRLVRDFPQFEHQSGDELPADPKQIWTDIPGAPRGLP
jgi:mxaK protein